MSSDSESEDEQHLVDDHVEVDSGHVACIDERPIDLADCKNVNVLLKKRALENVQNLFKGLLELPKHEGSVTIRELPKGKYKLPRHKPIPKPKPLTKWEKFAKEKGIQKRKKRDKFLWDEETQSWKPRYGFGRATEGGEQEEWCIELKDGEDGSIDKFKQKKDQKKLRVLKNRAKFLRNKAQNETSPAFAVENLNVAGARSGASKRGKDKVTAALKTAQVSTASLGRFDQKLEGEGKRTYGSTKRKFQPSETTQDTSRDKKILSRILGKHIGTIEDPAPSKASASSQKKRKKGRK